MRQSLTALALPAVTSMVTVPCDHAAVWQGDVGEQLQKLVTPGIVGRLPTAGR